MTCPDHISVNHFGQVAQIAVGEGGSRGGGAYNKVYNPNPRCLY